MTIDRGDAILSATTDTETHGMNTTTNERRIRGLDLFERVIITIFFGYLALRVIPSIGANPANGLALISEGLVALFVLIRRPAHTISLDWKDWAFALIGTIAPMMVRPTGHPLTAPGIGAMVMLIGLAFTICSKFTLRRSFGIAAANRGLVKAGPYKLVRHPIYAGYLVIYVGFFMNNPSAINLAFYTIAVTCFIMRIRAEERQLAMAPDYVVYRTSVTSRLIPGVY